MMTGREMVIRAVKFQGPERIPYMLPEPWGSDFLDLWVEPDIDWQSNVEGQEGKDEWGCIWRRLPDDKTMGQIKIHPLDDYTKLNNYPFPDYNLPVKYEKIKESIKKNHEQKFSLVQIPFSLSHRLDYLRGNESAWTDPYEHPRELSKLLDILADITITIIGHLKGIGVDGIFSCDDWGLQDRSLVSPQVFRQFFKPRYKKVYETAHRLGMLTFMHSCGHITELLDDFIEAGLDVIQLDQQENMGVENLANRFGGRICFWCPVDIQQTMVKGTPEDIRSYVRHLIDSFGRFNGGFIAKWHPQPDAIGHSKERIDVMSEAFLKYGIKPTSK